MAQIADTVEFPAAHTVALLNCLPRRFEVSLQIPSVPAFAFDLSGHKPKVHIIPTRYEYQQVVAPILRALPKHATREIPEYTALRDLLWWSGVVGLDDKSSKSLDALFKCLQAPDPHGLHEGTRFYIGFDTNALRARLLTTHILPEVPKPPERANWTLLYSSYNREELESRDDKIQSHTLNALENALYRHAGGWLTDVLKNQPALETRRREIGLLQLAEARGIPGTANAPARDRDLMRLEMSEAESYSARTHIADKYIIQSYETFAATGDRPRKVFLLTLDQTVPVECLGCEGVEPVPLRHANRRTGQLQTPLACTWQAATDLLSLSAILFAAIEIRTPQHKLIARLQGRWPGRGSEEVKQSLLRLSIPDNSTITPHERPRFSTLTAALADVLAQGGDGEGGSL